MWAERNTVHFRVWRSLVSRLNGVQEAASSNLVTRTNLEDLKSYDFESSFLLSQTFCPVSKCRTISVSNGFLTDSSTRAMQTAGQLLRQSLFAGIVQMTIDVCCHLNIAVTHPFLYILEVAAVIQKQTGAAMTKLVKTNMRKTVLFQKVRESFGNIIR